MKSTAFASILLLALCGNVSAEDTVPGTDEVKTADAEVDISPGKEDAAESAPSPELGDFCFFAGTPPVDVQYKVIKKLKVAKGSYGSVRDILPKFATYAKKKGAEAIVNYTGSQRFGFWPWRMVRPVVRGTAIKWSVPPAQDCAAMGGSTLNSILATDKPPVQ